MFLKSLAVLILCVLIALYVNEYHISTLNNAIKSSPQLDSAITSFQIYFQRIYNQYISPIQTVDDSNSPQERIFTVEELKKYTTEETGLYLAILGKVYDVSKGKKFYGEKGGYRFFTGRDGSRAFVTGDFTESGLTDHVLDLPLEDISGLFKWAKVYDKDYKYKGKLVGRYYDDAGEPTDYLNALKERLELAKEKTESAKEDKTMFPPCNMEWNQELGSRVWCTKMSGGIKRDWVGVPRKLYEPGSDTFRCACVNLESIESLKRTLREYTDCDPKADACDVRED